MLEQELEIKQIILPILLFLTPTPSLDPLLHPKTFLQSVLKQEEQKDLPQDKAKGIPKPFSDKNCWVYLNSEWCPTAANLIIINVRLLVLAVLCRDMTIIQVHRARPYSCVE